MEEQKNKLLNALSDVLQLDAIASLRVFLEGEVSLLFLLFQENKPLPPTEIAKKLNVSKGRVTALLNSLSDKEYIDIEVSNVDRRRFDVSLNLKGLEYLNEKRAEADKYFEIMIERIGKEKTDQLIGIITDIVRVMED